ncbi:MAG: UvrABC system protein B [Lentisphaerae bacterium ADurb.Bin242]|nr:MAG: UvrABC system protein B [Lentisphaerae bacterium ADurb.Bin242]
MFRLVSEYIPAGDQPQAIDELVRGLKEGRRFQTLLGVTGSGKTFTLANMLARVNRPALMLSHNKTLAAQLYSEFKSFLPENAVEFFVSYYDYYLPESYIPQTDTYIAKDASINENIERLRLSATASLLERRDVLSVASVSCIYGLTAREDYEYMCIPLSIGMEIGRNELLRRLVDVQFDRNDTAPERGQFRVRGDCVDIFLAQKEEYVRVEFWGDAIESMTRCDPTTGRVRSRPDKVMIFPARHFVLPQERIDNAMEGILEEMRGQVAFFESQGKLVEAQRLYQRVTYDVEMMREIGYCAGIENYSRHLGGRAPGSRPFCLLDFFPKDYITIIDESHATIPQLMAMYKADRSRKQTLVDHGFRLPSALDNRPLKFEEFESLLGDVIFVSATPAEYELKLCGGAVVEQVVRPTGLLDPPVEVRPLEGQVDDVMEEIRKCTESGGRSLVATLTKKSAERLADYLSDLGLRVKYLHSEIDVIERVKLLTELRRGDFDCIVGINLLREGIDLPELKLVAILDADKEGFLRSGRSLIQVAGRAARNIDGKVILYGDRITDSMKALIDTTHARRAKQDAYNKAHHITPKTILKAARETITDVLGLSSEKIASKVTYSMEELKSAAATVQEDRSAYRAVRNSKRGKLARGDTPSLEGLDFNELVAALEQEMLSAAENLEFERAAQLRDQLKSLQNGVSFT